MQPIPEDVRSVIDPLPTKSAKIRALNRRGFRRADIARFLNIRYQHVRNVLEYYHSKGEAEENDTMDERTDTIVHQSPQTPGNIEPTALGIDARGQISLPPEMRAAMMLGADGKLTGWIEDGELHLIGPRVALQKLRQLARKLVPEGVSVVDEFIAERRRDAERE